MGKETESYKLYNEAAKDSTDPKVKAMFERMAKEENQHYEILEQTRYYLKEYSNWSIWEEGGPIEGG
jgi:rubrerythrin